MKKIVMLLSVIAAVCTLVSCAKDVPPAPAAAPMPAPVATGHHHHHHDYKGEAQ